jgi:hypothetical protein
VKVKVLSIYDPSYHRYSTPPPAEQVESMLQEWLNDNPNAKIEHVQTWSLLTTIFYRD